jgi:hypothetical protein
MSLLIVVLVILVSEVLEFNASRGKRSGLSTTMLGLGSHKHGHSNLERLQVV